jgi:putative transposase
MAEISYRRHRFPPVVIQNAVWLYLRFTLSYRDVGDLLAERGLDISYETVRSWVLKFGPGDRATATAAPSSAEQPMASG